MPAVCRKDLPPAHHVLLSQDEDQPLHHDPCLACRATSRARSKQPYCGLLVCTLCLIEAARVSLSLWSL